MIPHLVLRELDVPFEWVHVDRARDAHKAPDYLRLNPNGLIDAGNEEGARQVRAHAGARIGGLLDQLDAHLAASGCDWILGERYSVLDPYAFTLCRWTRTFQTPARARVQLGPYLQRVLERPATRRVLADEGVLPPAV
jgi:glutathione S-transferase